MQEDIKIKGVSPKKKKLRLLFITFIAIFLLAYLAIGQKNNPEKTPTPSPMVNPTSFRVTGFEPENGIIKSVFSSEVITFTFNKNLNPTTISYTISPSARTRVLKEERPVNFFTILPLEGWKDGIEYTIILSNKITSTTGELLVGNLEYKITRISPQPGDPEYPTLIEESEH